MSKPAYTKKRSKQHIDFSTLTTGGLQELSGLWEKEARIFEARLQSYMFNNPNPNEEKVERLWRVGFSLWNRVSILSRWRIKNKK